MFHWLERQYAKRVVNVNINILLAGLLALAPTLLIVRLVEHLLQAGVVSGAKLHLGEQAVITATTLVADIIFDVSIYYALHWLANHSGALGQGRLKRLKRLNPGVVVGAQVQKHQARIEGIADAAVESVPFFKDATKVQFERMVLSPLLYTLFLGTQFVLMRVLHVRPVLATVCGFFIGITIARTLHTLWMLSEDRRRRRAASTGAPSPGAAAAALHSETPAPSQETSGLA
jgi:hypothetical protein